MNVKSNPILLMTVALAVLTILCPASARAAETEAITGPSRDIALAFVTTGRLDVVLVDEGDAVEAGQVLARLDDGPERIEIDRLRAQAEDRTRIEAALAELAQKRVDLNKLRSARAKGAVTDWEIEHVTLGVRIAELSLKAAELEHEQFRRRYAQAVSQLDRMCIQAPIAGRVEKVGLQPGEAAKTLGPVIQLVLTDPLWVEVPVPLDQAGELGEGNPAWVSFPGEAPSEPANGRIIHVASVADAASETLRFRIEVANPGKRPAGERVRVSFARPPASTDPTEGGQTEPSVDLSHNLNRKADDSD